MISISKRKGTVVMKIYRLCMKNHYTHLTVRCNVENEAENTAAVNGEQNRSMESNFIWSNLIEIDIDNK